MSTYTPQERDIIEISLEGAKELCERFQDNLGKKGRFVSLSHSERETRIQRDKSQLSLPINASNDIPSHINSRIRLSWYYEMQDEIDQAIGVLETTPATYLLYCPTLYAQLISLYERKGDYQKAHYAYEHILKRRPAICLRMLPRDQVLVCGFSTHQRSFVENFDQISHFDGKRGGIHLSFLGRIRTQDIQNSKGQITKEQHVLLLEKLREYLKDPLREHLCMPDLYKISPRL